MASFNITHTFKWLGQKLSTYMRVKINMHERRDDWTMRSTELLYLHHTDKKDDTTIPALTYAAFTKNTRQGRDKSCHPNQICDF
jgi:hypothetical protein